MDRYRYITRKQNPSFSSTLLDTIYHDTKNTTIDHQVDNTLGGSQNTLLATSFENRFPASLRPLRINELNTQKQQQHEELQPRAGKFVKPKSRAMKIYSYMKKGTHPVSPGGRLTRFLISLFSTTNDKKSKISPPCNGGGHNEAIAHDANRKFKSTANASSFSRSCLNQTTSSFKRNIDEYSHKSLDGDISDTVKYGTSSIKREVTMHVAAEETTRNLLKNYRKKAEYVFDSIRNNDRNKEDDEETESYASSDLFELDHLSTIGIDRCIQELPLYETTSVDANRAIANGLLD